jgi:hypothetical protein
MIEIILAPISKETKSKSKIDYLEQMRLVENNNKWRWDDSSKNSAKIGDLFGFYFHGIKVIIHRIECIYPSSERLISWTKNVNRNVLELSDPLIEMSWEQWISLNAYQSRMGTYKTKQLSKKCPDLYNFFKNCKELN